MKIPKQVLDILKGGKKIGTTTIASGAKNVKGLAKFGIGFAAFEGVSKLLSQANDNATNDNDDGKLRPSNDDTPEKVRSAPSNENATKIAPFRVNKSMTNKIAGINDNNMSSASFNKYVDKEPSNQNNRSASSFNRYTDKTPSNQNNLSAVNFNQYEERGPANDAVSYNSTAGLVRYTQAIPSNENTAAKAAPIRKKRHTAEEIEEGLKRKNNVHFLASIIPYLKNQIDQKDDKINKLSATVIALETRVAAVEVLEKKSAAELKTVKETVRVEKIVEDKRYAALSKAVLDLKSRLDIMKKEAEEKAQADEFARKEDVLEGKDKKGGAFKDRLVGVGKNKYVRDAIGPLALAVLMGMGALKQMSEGLQEQFSDIQKDFGEMALKLAAVGLPGFAVAKFLKDKMDKLKAPPTTPPTGAKKTNVPETKVGPKGDPAEKPKKGVFDRILNLEERLKNAPPWVQKVLSGAKKLAGKITSKLPLIGIVVDVTLNILEEYDPKIHKNPNEFQKLLISSILKTGVDTLVFASIIGVFFLLGGPLGALAGILVYAIGGDKITEAIQAELVGYLVKYVFFDEDPIEAAKKTGRYRSYEEQKAKSEKAISDAEANLKTIENKEKRGETLSPTEQTMKRGFEAQIEGHKKLKDKLTAAQNTAVEAATEEKKNLEQAKAEREQQKTSGGKSGGAGAESTVSPDGAGTGTGTLKGGDATRKQVYDAFVSAGFSDQQAKTLTAEVGRENSFQDQYLYGYHADPHNNAVNVGMFSWQGSRGKALEGELRAKGLIGEDGKLIRSQETLNAMAAFARKEMETRPEYARTKEEFLKNPNVDTEKAAEVLGDNYILWRRLDPKYAHHAEYRKQYYEQIDRITKQDQFKNTLEKVAPKPNVEEAKVPEMWAQKETAQDDLEISAMKQAKMDPSAPPEVLAGVQMQATEKRAELVKRLDSYNKQIANAKAAQGGQTAVTVVAMPPQGAPAPSSTEATTRPAPGEIPSPVPGSRPELNTAYAGY